MVFKGALQVSEDRPQHLTSQFLLTVTFCDVLFPFWLRNSLYVIWRLLHFLKLWMLLPQHRLLWTHSFIYGHSFIFLEWENDLVLIKAHTTPSSRVDQPARHAHGTITRLSSAVWILRTRRAQLCRIEVQLTSLMCALVHFKCMYKLKEWYREFKRKRWAYITLIRKIFDSLNFQTPLCFHFIIHWDALTIGSGRSNAWLSVVGRLIIWV